ncbi:MAG: hypothetical protein ACJ76N_26980 [Thermoanaerobaculia bacterium]
MRAADAACCLEAPERNRYFHGQMLYDRNFRLETDYHNHKRWLINRLVIGWGVVCGLGIRACEGDEPSIIVEPGLALDRCGREIVVDAEVGPLVIPQRLLRPPEGGGEPGYDGPREGKEDRYGQGSYGGDKRPRPRGREIDLHVLLCYHECTAGPTPVLAGDCRDEEPCQPGLIRERYTIEFRPGCLAPRQLKLRIPDVIASDGSVDYAELAKAVSQPCPCPEDPCVPLANLHLDLDHDSGCCHHREIDLSVRPIVYTNHLLAQLILSAVTEARSYRREE